MSMRKFIALAETLIEEEILNEAQDYNSMFNDLRKAFANSPDVLDIINTTAADIVPKVKSALKKNDRVVWYLKYFKANFIYRTLVQTATLSDTEMPLINPILDNLAKSFGFASRNALFEHAYRIPTLNNLGHYLSLPIAEIQNTIFLKQTPQEILDIFESAEAKWKEKANQHIDYDPNDGKIVIKFPDGFMWVQLPRGSCEREGQAMGHCGNVPSERAGQTLLSLRKLVVEDGKTFVRPSLTFILDSEGYLGETKARNNNKPDPKYHPYIVALLKTDLIKGITGGGYKPENNFSLNDLPEEQKQELLSLKPELGSLYDLYTIEGTSDRVLSKLTSIYKNMNFKDFRISDDKTYCILKAYDNINDLVDEIGDRTAKFIVNNNDEYYDFEIQDDEYESFLEHSLSRSQLRKIGDYLMATYPDQIAQWEEDEDEIFAPTSGSAIFKIIDLTDDELKNSIYMAVQEGYQSGTSKKMNDAIESALRDHDFGEYHVNMGYIDFLYYRFGNETNDFEFDAPIYVCAKIQKAIDAASDEHMTYYEEPEALNAIDEAIKSDLEIREPNYGFTDYDSKYAKESFFNYSPEFA